MAQPVSTLHPDWPRYDATPRAAVRGLTAEQLALRAGPDHGPVWAVAAPVAGARAVWLCGVVGEPGVERTPFTEPETGAGEISRVLGLHARPAIDPWRRPIS